jgi:SAM-dependent methyltransferase
MNVEQYRHMAALEDRHWWFRARLRVVSGVLRRYVKLPCRGLDCSCGTGLTLARLPEFVQMGADISPDALGPASLRGHRRLLRADLRALPLADAGLDLVTSLDTLEHIEDDARAMAEILRVLRPGGQALVTVPAHPALFSGHDRALHHVRRYRFEELRDKLVRAGFAIVRLTPINAALLPVVALARLLSRDKQGSDSEKLPPGPMNAVLQALFALEAGLIGATDLPFGVSLLALVRKPS